MVCAKLKFYSILAAILFLYLTLNAQSVVIQNIKDRALKGDIESQFKMACIYHLGCYGAGQNNTSAIYWAQKSADAGNVKAQCLLANLFFYSYNFEKHIYYLRKSAESGYSWAQGLLGNRLLRGSGVKQDVEEGVHWIIKSAESGNRVFQNDLSYCYYEGKYVSQNSPEGAQWLVASAMQNYIPAMATLYLYYRTGNGVSVDLIGSAYWCKKVAEAEVPEINCFDEEFLFAPCVFTESLIIDAWCTLGKYYMQGIGVVKDKEKGIYWIKKAKNAGSGDAEKILNEYN